MAKINTVLGEIDSSKLGVTLMHEHIQLVTWNFRINIAGWYDQDRVVAHAVAMIERAKKYGLNTIVEPCSITTSRDIDTLKMVSELAQINIICGTGWSHHESHSTEYLNPDYMLDIVMNEIEHGIGKSGVKPGVIKCGTDKLGVTLYNRKTFRVNAAAHKLSGLPLMTHTNSLVVKDAGMRQIEMLEEEGADMSKVIIGHVGDLDDVEYLVKLLQHGCFIGLDRFGIEYWKDLKTRIRVLMELYNRGYADQLILSHDCSTFLEFPDEGFGRGNPMEDALAVDLEKLWWQYDTIFRRVFPEIEKQGITKDDERQFMVENPRAFFEGRKVRPWFSCQYEKNYLGNVKTEIENC